MHMKKSVLVADNLPEDLATCQRILISAGYDVHVAHTLDEARDAMNNWRFDLAIIDLRLCDDKDANDLSGLILAKEKAFRHIPKIILTAFAVGFSELREVLGPVVDELPPTVAFVKKDERPQVLLEIIRQTLETWPRLRAAMSKLSEQIRGDHEEARYQARLNYRAAFILSVIGAFIMFLGISLAWLDQLAIGLVGTTGGIIIEFLSYLFFTRVNLANDRMDFYHQELLQTYWFDFLLAASEELPGDQRIESVQNVIYTAVASWLSSTPGMKKMPVVTKKLGQEKNEA
jgi:CheY-like chemotaxis protein